MGYPLNATLYTLCIMNNSFKSFFYISTITFILIFSLNGKVYSSAQDDKSIGSLLNSAEAFFFALKDKKFETVWTLLSEKSHKTIINDVYRASKDMVKTISKEDIVSDFQKRGSMFNNYWNSFLSGFDPNIILEESQWKIGAVKKNNAEIIMRYKKSVRPTYLKLFKENGAWKIGLVETFWPGKKLKFLKAIFK